jgi:hypothetical protein
MIANKAMAAKRIARPRFSCRTLGIIMIATPSATKNAQTVGTPILIELSSISEV